MEAPRLFQIGTRRSQEAAAIVLNLDNEIFPYQELRSSVLVWHTTCIRRGQIIKRNRKWEACNKGFHS